MEILTVLRRQDVTIEEYTKHGDNVFRSIYAETADRTQTILDSIYPDMGKLLACRLIIVGC